MRLIDANKVAEAITWLDALDFALWYDVQKCIDKQPTVDIDAITESHEKIGYDKGFRDGYAQATSEVRHGHWKVVKSSNHPYGNDVACSVCGFKLGSSFGYGFCPNCGVKMDESKDETKEREENG